MTDADISAAYARLSRMAVPLSQDPTFGPEYLQEKIFESRGLQDEATTLYVTATRALSGKRQEVNVQRAVVRIAPTGSEALEKRKLDALVEELDRLKYLVEAIRVRRQNLIRTSADVRLLLDCIKLGLQGGLDLPAMPIAEAETVPPLDAAPVDAATAGDLDQFYSRPVSEVLADLSAITTPEFVVPADFNRATEPDDAFLGLFVEPEDPLF